MTNNHGINQPEVTASGINLSSISINFQKNIRLPKTPPSWTIKIDWTGERFSPDVTIQLKWPARSTILDGHYFNRFKLGNFRNQFVTKKEPSDQWSSTYKFEKTLQHIILIFSYTFGQGSQKLDVPPESVSCTTQTTASDTGTVVLSGSSTFSGLLSVGTFTQNEEILY